MKKRLIIATMAFTGTVIGVASTASAAQPANPSCLGQSVSANAKLLHPYGQVVLAPNAPRSEFGRISDAVHAVQAGIVEDDLFSNTCND